MTFAIRAELLGNTFGEVFKLSNAEIGWCIGTAFWGFTLAIIIGGVLVDILGMKKILIFAFIGHLTGIIILDNYVIIMLYYYLIYIFIFYILYIYNSIFYNLLFYN